MKTIYQAIDGTTFQDELSCKDYEAKVIEKLPKMYDRYGCITTELDSSLVIEIKTDNQIGLLREMAEVDDAGDQFEYITYPCVAIWDSDEHYIPLDKDVLQALAHYVKQEL